MGFNFPNSPTPGQSYTPVGGYQYVWDGTAWRVLEAPQLFATAQSRNRIVNPSMQISQELGDGLAPQGGYPADQWAAGWGITPGVLDIKRVRPSDSGSDAIQVAVSTAKASLAAGDYSQFFQKIEGNKVKDFLWGSAGAKQAVLRFSIYATAAGTYSVFAQNFGFTRSFLAPFTVPANVWTKVSIVIPGDTTGTWLTDTSHGIMIGFSFGCGTTYSGTAGWQAGQKMAVTGTTNGFGASNVFIFTDVGLYLDPDATGRAPQWQMPDEAEELRACQRYYYKTPTTPPATNTFHYSTGTVSPAYAGTIPFQAAMRIAPAGAMIAAPNLSNCTSPGLLSNVNSGTLYATTTATGHFQASSGIYAFSARM